ncbi:MAG: EamA family transporter [Anaerolineales bacterium]|nr:EamA family transporter [Anaerolineales bacterium]
MSLLPFSLVIISAVTHGIWNFLAKSANQKDVFIGLSKISEALIFLPLYLFLLLRTGYGDPRWGSFVVVAAGFVFLNYFFLSQAYKRADLSVAYPISRASTLFLPLLSFFFLGERVDAVGWVSILLITAAIPILQLDEFSRAEVGNLAGKLRQPGILFALLAALMAASYTIWDKIAVSSLPPFLYFYGYTFLTALFYVILLQSRFSRGQLREEWQQKWPGIIAVALLNTFTYLLILVALGLSKAAYVGALRQLSLVIGVMLGWRLLGERVGRPKLVAVLMLVAGSALIAFAR